MLNEFLNTPMMSIHAHQPFCTTLNDDMKAYLSIPFEEFHGWFPRLSLLHFNQIYLISHTQFICSSTARAAVNSRALLEKKLASAKVGQIYRHSNWLKIFTINCCMCTRD